MEDSQLEHRIRLFQHIQEAWRDSARRRSLVEILADHTFGMTRDELEKFLFENLAPSLEEAWRNREAAERKLAEKDRALENERRARKAAEKNAADREMENAALKKALEDERNRNKTHVRNKFGSSSRRSCTAKDDPKRYWPEENRMYPNMEKWRDDPDYEIGNNFAERAARPVAMHRKTQNHVASHKGAEASCILRSLIETCKLWKVSVCEYLNRIFTAFSVGRTDYDNLMPWCMPSFS